MGNSHSYSLIWPVSSGFYIPCLWAPSQEPTVKLSPLSYSTIHPLAKGTSEFSRHENCTCIRERIGEMIFTLETWFEKDLHVSHPCKWHLPILPPSTTITLSWFQTLSAMFVLPLSVPTESPRAKSYPHSFVPSFLLLEMLTSVDHVPLRGSVSHPSLHQAIFLNQNSTLQRMIYDAHC